jgi:dTDP-4-amino-4,6-dideoxygalactose transaminase
MLRFGRKEIQAFARVAQTGQLFRYHDGSLCTRFEARYAEFLGVPHALLTSSGSTALTAALAGLGIGPGDEVIVPAHTYMATALAVLAVGAIPVIVDIDDSIMLDPVALDDAVGPHTKAVIPVHMWGQVCDMDAIMAVAARRNLRVIEDACQCVCGSYNGRMVGSIGHAGAFSFNFFKNMTCGEGGAVVLRDEEAYKRASCMVDACCYFWSGRQEDFRPFAAAGSRASELDGAILDAQLDAVPGLLKRLRKIKARVLAGVADTALRPSPRHSPDGECATYVTFQCDTAAQAEAVAAAVGAGICANTGRHTYTEWDPVLERRGAHHPALDPFNLPENRECRMTYSKDMLPRSLDILSRTLLIGLQPRMTSAQVTALIGKLRAAAQPALA